MVIRYRMTPLPWPPASLPSSSLLGKGFKAFLARRGEPTRAGGESKDFGPHGVPLGTKALTMEMGIQRLKIASSPVSSSHEWTCKLFSSTVLPRWLGKSLEKMSHRLTQILTDHGCFYVFIHRICRVSSLLCTFCEVPERNMMDSEASVVHTLVDCTAFDGEQVDLVRQIGVFVPGDLVSRMVESPSTWVAVEN